MSKHIRKDWQLFFEEPFKTMATLCGVRSHSAIHPLTNPGEDLCRKCCWHAFNHINWLDQEGWVVIPELRTLYANMAQAVYPEWEKFELARMNRGNRPTIPSLLDW